MAPETSPPGGATRYLQTTLGLLSYSQLAPMLAERVLRVERDIAAGAFAVQALAPDLLLAFNAAIAADLCPDWAGRWRDAEADTSALEREIDGLVYALYGLTPEEKKIVEDASA